MDEVIALSEAKSIFGKYEVDAKRSMLIALTIEEMLLCMEFNPSTSFYSGIMKLTELVDKI